MNPTPDELKQAVERLNEALSSYKADDAEPRMSFLFRDFQTILSALESAQTRILTQEMQSKQLLANYLKLEKELAELRELIARIRMIGTGELQVASNDTDGLQVIVDNIDSAMNPKTK